MKNLFFSRLPRLLAQARNDSEALRCKESPLALHAFPPVTRGASVFCVQKTPQSPAVFPFSLLFNKLNNGRYVL